MFEDKRSLQGNRRDSCPTGGFASKRSKELFGTLRAHVVAMRQKRTYKNKMKFNLHTSRKFSSAVAARKKESKIKTYEFILGDCLENLKKIEDKSIDLVVTSPPYNIGLKYHKYEDKKPREQYLEWIYDIFTELKRVLKDDGHIFLNMGYTNKDPWISMEVAIKLKDLFTLQNKITWIKSISIGEDKDDTHGHFKPINSDRYINVTNEDIYHFTKTDKVKINREAVGVPYKWKCNLIDRKTKLPRINGKTGLPVEDKRCKGNSWFVPYDTINSKKEKGYHPATFPESLVEHCIKISDIKQGTILDPFIGSGTTIRVAKKMSDNLEDYDLSGIGIDIDEEYIKFCNETFPKGEEK